MARLRMFSLHRHPASRIAARLALLLFALRAMLPVGYMPDLGALKEGQVQIVICTGTGTQALFVDASGQPIDHESDPGEGYGGAADCAFAAAMAKAVAQPPVLAVLVPLPAVGLPSSAETPALQASSEGPPLGPRAPPVLPA
jgi:hypothetical protein